MHSMQVTNNNCTIVDITIQEVIKCMWSTAVPSLFCLASCIKIYLDILNILLDISIPYHKIDISNFKFCHLIHVKHKSTLMQEKKKV